MWITQYVRISTGQSTKVFSTFHFITEVDSTDEPMEDGEMNDCKIIEDVAARDESITKIEFLSPHYKHKGKDLYIIDGNLLKMAPSQACPRPRPVRSVC